MKSYNPVLTDVKIVTTLLPIVARTPNATKAMKVRMRAYSTIACPSSALDSNLTCPTVISLSSLR